MKRNLLNRVSFAFRSISPQKAVNSSRRRLINIVTRFTLLVMFTSLFPAPTAGAAGGSFAWARSTDGIFAHGPVFDSAGNVYTTGPFEGTVDFDPGPGTYTLTSAGSWDIFVSKLDSNGNFMWARSMGGDSAETSSGLAVDVSGNVYITGYFYYTADFDPGPGIYTLTSASLGASDIFVSKLDSNGNFMWVRQMGGVGGDYSGSLAIDASGNLCIPGYFESTADFDPGPGSYSLTSAGSYDIFVSKLDSSGNFVWARRMGGVGSDLGYRLATDAIGSVYTLGWFEGTADFDPGPGIYTLTSAGSWDIFISKLDSNGDFARAGSLGDVRLDKLPDMAVDSAGNIYTTGTFESTADFDPGPGSYSLTSAGSFDIFVTKLDSNLDFMWARRMGGVGLDEGGGIATDASGSAYTTGWFEGTADLDPGPGMANLTSAGGLDIFVSRLSSSGNYSWARRMGGSGADRGESVAVDAGNNVYTTGTFESTADFDPGPGSYSLTSAGSYDIFVSKLHEAAIFEDVAAGYWALDFIERLYNAGITGGCATNPLMYCPEETVTRAQMAVFLLRNIHTSSYTPPATGPDTGFRDVPSGYWAADFIKQLAAEGITSGCGNGNYCPEHPVTRAQMAVFLLRSKYGIGYTPPDVGAGTGFGDVPTNYWAAAFIKQLVTEGITAGCGSSNYCPEQPVTRAQMAVFLVRTFSLP